MSGSDMRRLTQTQFSLNIAWRTLTLIPSQKTRKESVIHMKKKITIRKFPSCLQKKKILLSCVKSGVTPEEFWPFYDRLKIDQNITNKTADKLQEADVVEESDDDIYVFL